MINIATPSRFPYDMVIFVPDEIDDFELEDSVCITQGTSKQIGKVVGKDATTTTVKLDIPVLPGEYPTDFEIEKI